ncbi:hypothetical protein APHAL10511_007341 [Amanita phalloides]|nr:hypothetical protein APHAL10511_007341 [Amanita phalloides]
MFACVVAGRMIQTDLHQVDETHAYFELPNASSINHITVFLLGTIAFPNGLSNEKPSAIFRLRGTFSASVASTPTASQFSSVGPQHIPSQDATAILGLAIEPLVQIQQAIPTTIVKAAAPDPMKDSAILAERVVKHLFNYLNSFIGDSRVAGVDIAVPMSVLAKWYENFLTKLKTTGTGFLERDE